MFRKCRECGLEAHTEEELELFVVRKDTLYGRATICKRCQNLRNRTYDARRRYGISGEEYQDKMKDKECVLCGTTEGRMCYDHDHDTGEFRGVLCNSCNTALGKLGDSVESLERVLRYLKGEKI